MKVNRRDFLIFTATFAVGCATTQGGAGIAGTRQVDAGPASRYGTDGVYTGFSSQGFFVVRRDGRLFALSAICTHKKCKLKSERDRSFYCPCHGSTFDPNGHVTLGPAKRDLPVLATAVDEQGKLIVSVPGK
ncbi:MAG TPA: Rieske (2Fe-2S) protein [Verrucomicrobiae bacterium]|nr:Rieske (2Fe-2S) protein [Verrucomicrobiae bacterium]